MMLALLGFLKRLVKNIGNAGAKPLFCPGTLKQLSTRPSISSCSRAWLSLTPSIALNL
jgi:hypothetical protein